MDFVIDELQSHDTSDVTVAGCHGCHGCGPAQTPTPI